VHIQSASQNDELLENENQLQLGVIFRFAAILMYIMRMSTLQPTETRLQLN